MSVHESYYSPYASVGYLTKRISQMEATRLASEFDSLGVSCLQGKALISIAFGGGGTCRDLAREIAHDTGATTRLLHSLEESGLALRDRSTIDRRVVHILLTDRGRVVAQSCGELVTKAWSHWLSDWESAEVASLIARLRRLDATLRRETGSQCPK